MILVKLLVYAFTLKGWVLSSRVVNKSEISHLQYIFRGTSAFWDTENNYTVHKKSDGRVCFVLDAVVS